MKKSLAISIIMILIIGLLGGTVNAASASVSASSKSVTVGNTVTVTVSFGQKVSAAQFVLNFDSSSLEYVSKIGKGLFSASTKKYGYNSEDGITADLSSVAFTFKAKTTGTTTVSVSGLKISTETQTGISASIGNSSVTITINEKQATSNNGGETSNNNNSGSTTGSTNSGSITGNNNSSSTTVNNSESSSTNSSSNTNKNNSSSSNSTSTTNKNETKQETITTQEQVAQEEQIEEQAEQEVQPAQDELIRLENQDAKTLQNEATNVLVKGLPIAIEDETVLEVELIQNNNEKYELLENILKNIKGNKTYFDIKLLKNNIAIQPNGYVTVCIPIPEEYNKERIEVYYINEENGSYELEQGEIQGDYYTFTTNHFSTYVLVEKPEPKTFGQIITEIFTNIIVLYTIIGILVVIVIVETVIIIRMKKSN